MYTIVRLALQATMLMVAYLVGMLIYMFPNLGWVLGAVLILLVCKRRSVFSAYGTARWGNADDIPDMIEANTGLSVGQLAEKPTQWRGVKGLFNRTLSARSACQRFLMAFQRKPPNFLVRLSRAVHIAIFAPTGVGKGVSCVIPHLLTSRESMVVTDFKGENAEITARARRKMGHRTILLDPYKMVTQSPDTFNPLDFIDADSPTALDECRALAESIVVRTGQEKEPHWADSAEVWITAMIAVTVCYADRQDRNLQSVRRLLTDPERMQAAIKTMCESDHWQGLLARLGFSLTHFKDKELASTLTTTNRFLNFLDSIAISDCTTSSSFDPADLLRGRMTVYLILPPEHARTQSALLRLWIGSMLRAVVKGGIRNKNQVTFLLDEAASLGHMGVLDDAVDKYRAYSVRLIFLYQSLGQLKKCWPEGSDQTFLSSVTQVYYGVQDLQTADFVSSRCGEGTIVAENWSDGTGWSTQSSQQGSGGSTSYSGNSNKSYQQLGRKLLKPEEVLGLSERIAITFVPGTPPIWTTLVRYYEKQFGIKQELGPVKVVFDTLCFFLVAAFSAVAISYGIYNETWSR